MHVDDTDRHRRLHRETGRPARDARQPGHGAGQHGHLRLQHPLPDRAAPPRRSRQILQPRFRQGHHPLSGPPRQSRRPDRFTNSCVTLGRRTRSLLARRRHARCLLGGQHRPHRHHPGTRLYDRDWPIWTYAEITPPAKFVHEEVGRRGEAISSLVSGGCIVSGSFLRQSLLFTSVHVHSYARVEQAVILPDADIGRGARLRNVIVEKGVRNPGRPRGRRGRR